MMIISFTPQLSSIHTVRGSVKEASYELLYCKERSLMFVLSKKTNDLIVLNMMENCGAQSQLFSLIGDGELVAAQTCDPTVAFDLSNNITFEAATGSTVLEIIPKMISPQFRRIAQPGIIESALRGRLQEGEKPTAYVYGTLRDDQAYLIVGTNQGSLLLLRLFVLNNQDITIFTAKAFNLPVASIYIYDGHMYCSDNDGRIVAVSFDADKNHAEVNRVEVNKHKSLVVREISADQIKRVQVTNKLKKILPVVFIGEETQHQEEVLKFCKTLIGLHLDSNHIVLLEQTNLTTVFEYQFSDNTPIGLYYDRKSEFLNILYDKGDIDVFNVNFGNIMMLIKFKQNMADKHAASSSLPPEVEYQIKVFSSHCFAYERSTTISSHYLNLVDMLKDYKNTFVDLHSFSKFTGNPLINVTQNGSVFEFASQFYTNELLSTHIEYQRLKKGAVQQRPIMITQDDKKKKDSKKKQQTMEEAFQGITSLKDLNALLEQQNKEEKPEEKSETILIENIPLKLQNVLERNNFMLIRERLEEKPLKLLDYYEEKGLFVDDESQFSIKDVLKMLSYMNYANFDIFSDPQSKEDSVILKKTWGNRQFFIMNFYPPIFEAGNERHNMLISTVLFPYGIDVQSEVEFKAAFGDGFPTIEFAIGTQGVAEAFSFVISEHFLHINNHLETEKMSPVLSPRVLKEVSYLTVSSYITTSILLGVVSELIYLLKKGYTKVGPLINAIRTIFFEKMVIDIPDYKPVSQKILTLLTLNDKLLVSASSHFILNNIYDKLKIAQALNPVMSSPPEFIDSSSLAPISFYWLQIKSAKGYRESEPLSILSMISKFELYVISMLLYHIKLGGTENSSVPISRESVINMIHPILEVKIGMSYPFLVIPVIKICLETLPFINIRNNQKLARKLFHSVAYFSLYYGLTFEPDDQENPTYVNSELLEDDGLPSAKQLKGFVTNLRQQSYEVRRGIRVHILKLLKLLSELDLEFTLFLLNEMISSPEVSKLVAFNVIDISKYMIKFCEADFNSHIIMWSEILMKLVLQRSLNPNRPEIRKFCQKLATSSMKSLLKRYTFCAFHKETQHFFVPSGNHEIIIYDLRTAMRWKSLKGHSGLIESLAVQDSGQILASFSRIDKEIKLWKIGASGFFENLLRSSTELYKTLKITEEIPRGVELKISWQNNSTIEVFAPKVGWRKLLKC